MLTNKTVSLDSDMLQKYADKFGYGKVSEKIREAMKLFFEIDEETDDEVYDEKKMNQNESN